VKAARFDTNLTPTHSLGARLLNFAKTTSRKSAQPRSNTYKRTMDDMADTSHGWIAWTAAALLASLAHVLIDSHIGLYGETSSQMSLLQAANVLLMSLFYGWWIYAVGLASMGDKSALVSTLIIVVVWVLLANGVAAVITPWNFPTAMIAPLRFITQ
jgi:acyl-CoA reductase-like NAD-dependent aldehyde dehydrogenase